MQMWPIHVLQNIKATRDITSHQMQECLMAAQSLTCTEIIEAFWSESLGKAEPLAVQPQDSGATL